MHDDYKINCQSGFAVRLANEKELHGKRQKISFLALSKILVPGERGLFFPSIYPHKENDPELASDRIVKQVRENVNSKLADVE